MLDFKGPIIGSAIGFFLVLVINLIKGNSFFTVISRAFIYGLIVGVIVFLIRFIFKEVLKIELSAGTSDNTAKNDESSGIDIMVGDESSGNEDSDFTEESETFDTDSGSEDLESGQYNENIEFDSGSENIREKEPVMDTVRMDNDITVDSLNEVNINDDGIGGEFSSTSKNVQKNESDVEPEIIGDVDSFEINPTSDAAFELGTNQDISSMVSSDPLDKIKQKVGKDTSFEDIAKAIRTKLKNDK